MTPIWRRRPRAAAAARCCSWRRDDAQAERRERAMALFRARPDGCCPFRPGIACLTTASRPSPISKAAAGHPGGAGAGRSGGRRDRHHHQCRCCSACRRAPAIAEASFRRQDRRGGGPRGAGRLPGRQWLCPRRHGARAGRFRAARRHCRSVAAGRGAAAAAGFLRRDAGRHPPLRCRDPTCPTRQRWTRSRCCPPAKRRSSADAISRFRAGYVAAFGAAGDDPLYESVSAGRKAQGMEHWLPLFYDQLDTLFDYLPRCAGAAGPSGGGSQGGAAGTDRRLLRDPRAVPAPEGRQARHQGAALQAAEAGRRFI